VKSLLLILKESAMRKLFTNEIGSSNTPSRAKNAQGLNAHLPQPQEIKLELVRKAEDAVLNSGKEMKADFHQFIGSNLPRFSE
jgi:hypothetical protein